MYAFAIYQTLWVLTTIQAHVDLSCWCKNIPYTFESNSRLLNSLTRSRSNTQVKTAGSSGVRFLRISVKIGGLLVSNPFFCPIRGGCFASLFPFHFQISITQSDRKCCRCEYSEDEGTGLWVVCSSSLTSGHDFLLRRFNTI